MQTLINSWGSLMEVTGGALIVEKSWWYLVEYIWKRGKWVANDAGNELDLVATDTSGNNVSLNRLHCYESSQMLGVWLVPSSNKSKIIQELKKATVAWGAKARAGHLSQSEAWAALHTTISAKVKYPLPACTLTKEEYKSIMWPVLKGGKVRNKYKYGQKNT